MSGELAASYTETAYAKINLALHVRERMVDGYHRIETLFAFAADGDALAVAPADDLGLAVDGSFAGDVPSGSDNLVIAAAQALHGRFGVSRGASLRLTKVLPVASGIGGGSADAAAALRLLDRFWQIGAGDDELAEIAADLGADVPACLYSRTASGTGRGDRLVFPGGSELTGTPLLLVNPGIAVPTGDVFAAWDGIDRGPLTTAESVELANDWRNDLLAPARGIAPEIGDVLERLEDTGNPRVVQLSGSGATGFALYDTESDRDAAASLISEKAPNWWVLPSKLR